MFLCFLCCSLQWDDALRTDHFAIGYLDRFVGIIEKPFSAFSWEDLASVDSRTVLAVPKHRFQYVKYRDEIVWDKRVQMDNFFGSRGDGTTIADVVARHTALQEKKAAAKKPATSSSAQAATANESQPKLAFEDDEEEDNDEEETPNQQRVSHRPGPQRPNFFIGIRVTDSSIVAAAEQVQEAIVSGDPRLQDGVLPPTALHVTVCMLRVGSAKDAEKVKSVLAENQKYFMALFANSKLSISGVTNFRGRVVFAAVKLTPSLQRLNAVLLQSLRDAGIATPGNHEGFTPHMTLVKLSRPMCRAMGDSACIEPVLYSQFTDMDFGDQPISDLHVCSMTEPKTVDGFYVQLTSSRLHCDVLVPALVHSLQSRIHQLQDEGAIAASTACDLAASLQQDDASRHQNLVATLTSLSEARSSPSSWRFFTPLHGQDTSSTAGHLGCVYVLRGLPGSGKSHLTGMLQERLSSTASVKVCSADEYFLSAAEKDVEERPNDGGSYEYTSRKIHLAHSYCLDSFMEALNAGTRHVIVDNTHVQRWQYALYTKLASLCGYRCQVISLVCKDAEMARRLAERGQHSVPLPAVLRMNEIWEDDPAALSLSPMLDATAAAATWDLDSILSNPSDTPQYPKIFYTAIFLSQKSRRHLLTTYPTTHNDNVPEDMHCTIQFQPSEPEALSLPLGATIALNVLGCADDGRNQAVAVEIESKNVKSNNSHPHISLSYVNGAAAKDSNTLLEEWTAEGKPLVKPRDLIVTGTVGCMITSPPHDRLSIITDCDHLQRVLKEPVGTKTTPPAVLSYASASGKDDITSLYVYDFDGTLVDTLGPVNGRLKYKDLTGSIWPHVSWLGVPASLEPPLPLRPGPKMASFRGHIHRPHTRTVVLTGRQKETMQQPVAQVLRSFDVVPADLICQPYCSPVTADFKEDALADLISSLPKLKKVVVYDDLPDNLAAFESQAKRHPKPDWTIVDAATHEQPAKRYKDPLRQFIKQYGSLATREFHAAVTSVLEFLTDAWRDVLTSTTGATVDASSLQRLVIPFGSVVLGRRSDVDVCLVASEMVGITHMDWMRSLTDHLERCGVQQVHRGFSSRCPRLRCSLPLSSHGPIEVDAVFAILPSAAFKQLTSGDDVSIATIFNAIPKEDSVSHIALGGPLFAEEVLAVIERKQCVKAFAPALEAIVLLARAHHLKSNAFHFPRTFHFVKLLAQFVASAPEDHLSSATKLFSAFVRQSASMGKAKWAKLCREFVPEIYFPRLTEVLTGAQAMLKRPQDVTLDTIVTLLRPEEPHLALIGGGFWAKFSVVSKQGRPTATDLWKASVLLEARCGSYVRTLLDRGYLFQPDCRLSCDHLVGRGSAAERDAVLMTFAVHCSNAAIDTRDAMKKEFSPLLQDLSALFPADQHVVLSCYKQV